MQTQFSKLTPSTTEPTNTEPSPGDPDLHPMGTAPITDLDARLWAALEPLGYERYVGEGLPAGIQFYAPDADNGFIELGGRDVLMRSVDISIQIRAEDAPAFAAGLRALADCLEAGR